jgi:sec-independent protein translocase protein TatC
MSIEKDEDLFQNSTMTFGEHLEELRSCLIKALLWLLVGFGFGLLVGDWTVATMQLPLEESLQLYYQDEAIVDYARFAQEQEALGRPIPYTVEEVDRMITEEGHTFQRFLIHPRAARRQLGIKDIEAVHDADEDASSAGADAASPSTDKPGKADTRSEPLEDLVPLFVWRKSDEDPRVSVKALNPTEAFMIWLKASLVVGLIITSPMIFYQLWSFVAAGLYPHERKYVHVFLPFSVALFIGGAMFCFFIVFPFILDFLFDFNADLGIDPDPRISEWLSFAIILPVGFGISFQLPLVMLFLERIGIFDVPAYLSKWRIAILVIFVLSMLLTPADPMSMLAMAVPLTGLYFLGIALCRYMPKQKSILDE